MQSVDELTQAIGTTFGPTSWTTITQSQIDKFADATRDHQWIHTDPARAKTQSPFGKTIAHGYLTLSLAPHFLEEILDLSAFSMAVNYGIDKLRFITPVVCGSQVRMNALLKEVAPINGGAQIVMTLTFEAESATKPVCVADVVYRVYT